MERTIIAELLHWKNQSQRLPLLLRGARQVGKSYVVCEFGRQYFSQSLIINFEQQRNYIACFNELNPHSIIKAIEAISGQFIIPGETLLFLDEIQECPKAIMALRYFKEQLPRLHVIGAGSLLEFALKAEGFRMPVGRVQSLYLKPLSFYEYLIASNKQTSVDYLKNITCKEGVNPGLHTQLQTSLREYFVLGGMPAIIQTFLNDHSFHQAQVLQSALLTTYRDDFGKYASLNKHKYLQRLVESIPGLVGQHFRYAHIDPHMQSRELKFGLDCLIDAGIIYKIYNSQATGLPLNALVNEKKFKILFIDIGLVNATSLLSAQLLLREDLMLVNKGVLAEQFVGQELLAHTPHYLPGQLFYWSRDKVGSMAQIDYVINIDELILPIEVKAGKTGTLKSLQWFLNNTKSPLGIRISLHPLQFHHNILSVPLYMIQEIPRLVAEVYK